MKKLNRIGQIVKLRQFVKRWKTRAQDPHGHGGSTAGCSLSPRSKPSSPFSYDSDEDCCRRPASPPPDVPEGYLGVYVGRKGEDPMRFIIPTAYLTHPFFRALLDRAEEEFGFDRQGGLTIPCEVSLFNQLLRVLGSDDPASETLRLHDLLEFFCNERDCGSQAKAFPSYNFGFTNLML